MGLLLPCPWCVRGHQPCQHSVPDQFSGGQQCQLCHSSAWQGHHRQLSLPPVPAARQVLPAAPSPAVSTSPTHRGSKPGSFSSKSIKAGVQVEVGTAALGSCCRRALLCQPPGRAGAVPWRGVRASPGAVPRSPFPQGRARALSQRWQARRPGREPRGGRGTARGPPGPAGRCRGPRHGAPHRGTGTDGGQSPVGPRSLGLPTRLAGPGRSLPPRGSPGPPGRFLAR